MGEPCYVYAIAHPYLRIPVGLSGFGGPLWMVVEQNLAAVVSTLRTDNRVEPTPDNLLRHEAIVEALHATSTVLPARFGTVLAEPEAVSRALAEQHETFAADLLRLHDTVEFGVTLLWRENPTTKSAIPAGGGLSCANATDIAEHRGAAYLWSRFAEHRQAEGARDQARDLASDLETHVRPYVSEFRRRLRPSSAIALRDAYLVPSSQVAGFTTAVAEMRQRHQEVRLLMSGPWPPYSFITPTHETI